ncbi:MAG: hypothetical protein HC822_17640 [Oscillochloris sp.]|nr:hypothetical protein [Oscillochloris sp.]
MTIQSLSQRSDRLTLGYWPVLAWIFIALTAYGIGEILLAVNNGQHVFDSGTATALALLGGLAVFVAFVGGDVVIADFDRPGNRIRVRSFGLRGIRRAERPLNEVTGLTIQVLRRNQHRVLLHMQSGERLSLTSYYVVALGIGKISRLSDFLGVEPQIAQAPTGRWIR